MLKAIRGGLKWTGNWGEKCRGKESSALKLSILGVMPLNSLGFYLALVDSNNNVARSFEEKSGEGGEER